MGPHTEAETTLGTTSFLAICTKTKLTTGAFCLFYNPGLCVVLAAKYAQLRMLFLMSLTWPIAVLHVNDAISDEMVDNIRTCAGQP